MVSTTDRNLIVRSVWDNGVHKSFKVDIRDPSLYRIDYLPLSDKLSFKQIQSIELVILQMVENYLKDVKEIQKCI